MKFMFVNYWENHVIYGWKPALLRAGYEVVEYGGYETYLKDVGTGSRKVWNDIANERPNYVIMFGVGWDIYVFDTIIDACKHYGVGVILHNVEDPPDYEKTFKFSKRADLVLSGDIDCVERYKKLGIKSALCLPAINPDQHKPVESRADLTYDMAMLANCYIHHPARLKGYEIIVSAVMDLVEQNNCRFRVYGNWWDKPKGMEYLRGHDEVVGYLLPMNLIPALNSSAKITLGVQCVDYSKTQTSPRPYEALACRSFHLTQWTPATENIFKEGIHLVTAKTKEEAKDKMTYYLDHKDEREKIAKQGQEYVYNEHTYDKRISEALIPNL